MSTILDAIEAHERALVADAEFWRREAEYWKQRWWATVEESIRHNNDLYGTILKAALVVASESKEGTNKEAAGEDHGRQP